MLKKSLLIFMLFINFSLPSLAISDSDYLSLVEQNLYNTKFSNEKIDTRIQRIEKSVFGTVSKDAREVKIMKIKKALAYTVPTQSNPSTPKETPKPAIKKAPQKLVFNKPQLQTQALPPSVNYPIVDMMESRVLNRSFSNEDISKRLSRLEIIVFKQEMHGSLDDRVNRLKTTILGNNDNSSGAYNDDESSIQFDAESSKTIVTKLEEDTFKTTYPNEPIESRLSRLEMKMFNQDSPEDSVSDRIERLSSVIAAQPSNEMYRDMSKMRQYQQIGSGLTAATLVLLLLKALLF